MHASVCASVCVSVCVWGGGGGGGGGGEWLTRFLVDQKETSLDSLHAERESRIRH